MHVDSYGTGKIPDKQILSKVLEKFDFRPGMPCLYPPCPCPHIICHLRDMHTMALWQQPLLPTIFLSLLLQGLGNYIWSSSSLQADYAGMMSRNLDLLRGGNRYIKTAAYGHFGRDDLDVFTWEKVSYTFFRILRPKSMSVPYSLRECAPPAATVSPRIVLWYC